MLRSLSTTRQLLKLQTVSGLSRRASTIAATKLNEESLRDPIKFWGTAAKDIDWFKPYDSVLTGTAPHGRWFSGGHLNTAYNCIDRHVEAGRGSKTAIIYDSPVTNTIKKFSYDEVLEKTIQLAGVLRGLGVKKGDRVIIYMPNIPEAAFSMLACARIGAIHSVVFGGFADAELATRIKDSKPKVIISSSCGIENQKVIDYKKLLDSALHLAAEDHTVDNCLIFQRDAHKATLVAGRDVDMERAMEDMAVATLPNRAEVEHLESSDPLYILYTSGTTGKPKGVVRDNGGHAVALRWTMKNIYNMDIDSIFWAASDVGWVVGHSYSVYGPLLLGCTSVIYEGKPVGTPDNSNFWRVIERHGVNTLFTAPTALRSIKRVDEEGKLAKDFNLSTLRSVFLAGERADPDSLKWAAGSLGVPIRDHWWQTETGWPICSNLVGVDGFIPIKYGSTYTPCPGYDVQVLDDGHLPVKRNTMGNIAIKLPLPPGAMLTLHNNDARFHQSYLEAIPGYYDTGDAGYIDDEGYVFIMSRTDDVINVAGHRLSSGAMEEVISDHPDIAEVAVVGVSDALKGQTPLGLIVLNSHCTRTPEQITLDAVQMIRDRIGPVASFKHAVVVGRLPKTRSGKVQRGTMRAIANGMEYKVPATIEDPTALDEVAEVIKKNRLV